MLSKRRRHNHKYGIIFEKTDIVVEGREIVEESKSHENLDLDSKSSQTDLNEQVGNIENISKAQKDGLRALVGLSLNEIADRLGTKDGYTVVLFENENVTATYHAELEVPNDINVKSGYSVEDAIDDWTAQNPGRARLGHAFDPLVGSGGSVPTPVPVGVPGLVPVP